MTKYEEEIYGFLADGLSEITPDRKDLEKLVKATRGAVTHEQLRKIILKFVIAFSIEPVLIIVTIGAAAPDWGYDRKYVNELVSKYETRSIFLYMLNPFWWVGLVVIVPYALFKWIKLKNVIEFKEKQC